MEIRSILDLPLDIKIEILGSLDSVSCLRSTLLTCHTLFDISKTSLWHPIYTRVLERDIGAAGQALVKIRRFKARRSEVEAIEAFPTEEDEKPESTDAHLSEILSVRRPVRFFTRLFFKIRFMNRRSNLHSIDSAEILADMETITQSEYSRVDEAYYTLWLYRELNYNVELRSLDQVAAINEWTFWNDDGTFRVMTDVGILSHVLRVTSMGIIYPHVRKYGKTLSPEELSSVVQVVEALHLYEKHGVTSILITRLGFDGLHRMLESSEEEIQEVVSETYWYRIRAAQQGITPPGSITRFPSLISDLWQYIVKLRYKDGMQRAWKEPGGKYRIKAAPWNQYSQFDITALVWDDNRLRSWGYFHPVTVDPEEDKRVYDTIFENQMRTEDCCILGCTLWDADANPDDQ